MKQKKLYRAWYNMRRRAKFTYKLDANHRHLYKHVTLCKAWESFEIFRKWAISHGYKSGLWMDRIKNEKGYFPSNCRWVTGLESRRNQRITKRKLAQLNSIRKTRKVLCITTGEVFNSLADVTRKVIGRYSSGLNMALKRGRPYHGKEYRYL